jgi:L-iditol 2-dehydrogenase
MFQEVKKPMKQAVMVAPGQVEMREVPRPTPGPGEVLLRILRIGVCGSDVHVNHGVHPYTGYPVVQGHEFSALIEEVGPGVAGLAPGQLVTAMPQLFCGVCAPCRRGDYHICDSLKVQGFQAPGCAQEFWVIAADKIVSLPTTFTWEQGAMVEPVAVAVHAVGRAGELEGRNVAVLGAGPIGNLVAQVARAGGGNVLITDISAHRLELALRCGLAHTSHVDSEELAEASQRVLGSDGFQVAFDCVGVEKTITAAVSGIEKGGMIVVVGVFGQIPRVDLGLVQDRELDLRGTLMYKAADYHRAIELMASNLVRTEPLQYKHFPFDQYHDAYDFIDRQGDKSMKVFIDVPQS